VLKLTVEYTYLNYYLYKPFFYFTIITKYYAKNTILQLEPMVKSVRNIS